MLHVLSSLTVMITLKHSLYLSQQHLDFLWRATTPHSQIPTVWVEPNLSAIYGMDMWPRAGQSNFTSV